MSLTDGPLMVRPILAIQALSDAGVTLRAKIEEHPDGYGDRVKVEAVWRAEVRSANGAGHTTIPVVIEATALSIEEAAEQVLAKINRVRDSAEAAAARVAETPVRAF